MSLTDLSTAKVFVYHADGSFSRMIEYHNIDRRGSKIEGFEKFIRGKYPGVHHVNYYDKKTERFQFQNLLK